MEEYDLKLKREGIILKDESGTPRNYLLIELSGEDRDAYLTKQRHRLKKEENGEQTITDFKGIYSDLLVLSLYEVHPSSGKFDPETCEVGQLVDSEFIKRFPGRVQKALYDKSRHLSSLTIESEEEQKN